MANTATGFPPYFVDDRLQAIHMRAGAAVLAGRGYSGYMVQPEGGVMPGGDQYNSGLGVAATSPASMQVQLIAGQCIIPVADQHAYLCTLPTIPLLDIAAAHQTNDRIDLVIAEVVEDLETSANSLFQVRVVTGTPSATPAVPSLTGIKCLVLAEVYVTRAVTSIAQTAITDRRYFTRAAGGVRLAYNDNDRAPSGNGDMRVKLSSRSVEVGFDNAWYQIGSAQGWKTWDAKLYADNGGAQVTLGTGGSVNAKYQLLGKMLTIRALFTWGASGFYSPPGNIVTYLPSGLVNGAVHQKIMASLYVPGTVSPTNGRGNYVGQAIVWENSSKVSPMFPFGQGDCRVEYYRIAQTAGTAGTGVPLVPGGYPEGGNLVITGTIELP
ncbi:hypothetical protein [Saccharopolyspora sp. 6V]|uniref:hypothetical protein n=1 Tax=Saccharopolyspora sp. 6V TaxID=2877239 RepID=UPI001CD6368A|nr:hypothetical protein [Saccharopolyspora sp. 6V]MCA1191610.1 hypothetical protein [Saccharopolyspora sp. 6V]